MITLLFSLLEGTGQTPADGMTSMLVMMAILFAIVYFFMIRPQNKRQKAIDEYRKALHVGSDVVTVGGLHGTVKRINEENNTLVVNVATGVDLVFEKSAIVPPAGETKA